MNTMLDKGEYHAVRSDYKSLPEIVRISRLLKCNEWTTFHYYPGMPTVEEVKESLEKCRGTFAVYRTINGIGVRRLSA